VEHSPLIALTVIVVLGIVSQWLAWVLKLPAILLLLVTGFIIGPVARVWFPESAFAVHPDMLFGDALFPVVSVAVALILFEGGMALRFSRITEIRNIVLRMVTVGVLLTWTLTTGAAWLILDFRLDLALLLGAILVVTGPTVIIPLLRHVRPKPRVGALVRWEGIINDPIGAVLAVLVFEGVLAGGFGAMSLRLFQGLAVTVTVATALAAIGALILIFALKRHWIPDFLESPATLALVISVFTCSNVIQEESGLVAVTLMGIILANQNMVKVGHIVEFKENLRVLLISTLFVVLAARIDPATVSQLSGQSAIFLAVLILVVRPLAIFGSTIGTELSWKSRVFVSAMAPRGIVAAAVASLFAFELAEHGVPRAEHLLSETFLVITGTVAIYGLLARGLAQWLGLAQSDAHGVVIAGSHSWSLQIGQALNNLGYDVEIIAQDPSDVEAARHAGLRAQHGSAASHEVVEELDLTGFGKFVALSATDEVNLLSSMEFSEAFGSENVFRLESRPTETEGSEEPAVARRRGRVLFSKPVDYDDMDALFRHGGEVRTMEVSDPAAFEEYCASQEVAIPMFYVRGSQLYVCSTDAAYTAKTGDTVICAVRG